MIKTRYIAIAALLFAIAFPGMTACRDKAEQAVVVDNNGGREDDENGDGDDDDDDDDDDNDDDDDGDDDDVAGVAAGRNRYAMELLDKNGRIVLKQKQAISEIIDYNSLPDDAFVRYNYAPLLINDSDLSDCRTTEHTYKDRLIMKVDIPTRCAGPYPFIIYVHGGGWSSGNADVFKAHSQYLASRGIAGIRISYTLTGDGGTFDMGMAELEAAYQYVLSHAEEWDLDTKNFGYAGGSAGTPLAALAAMKNNGCKLFMGSYGIYDFQNNLEGNFGKSSGYFGRYTTAGSRDVISAINFIPDRDIPALLLMHGTTDFTISWKQSEAFHNAVVAKGGRSEFLKYDYYSHSFLNRGFSDIYETVIIKMYEYAKDVFDFEFVPLPDNTRLLGEYNFTTGSDCLKPEKVAEGLAMSDMAHGNLNVSYRDEAMITSNWVGINVGAGKWIGCRIEAKPGYAFVVDRFEATMKRSAGPADALRLSYGSDKQNSTQHLGVLINAGSAVYDTYILRPNAEKAPTEATPYFAIGAGAWSGNGTEEEKRSIELIFDKIEIYGTVVAP